MLRATFDLDPKAGTASIIRRLATAAPTTGSDGRVWGWFRANLKWTIAQATTGSNISNPQTLGDHYALLDLQGRLVASTEVLSSGGVDNTFPPGYWNTAFTPGPTGRYPTIAAQGAYANTLRPLGQFLYCEINVQSYDALATAMRHCGPNPQSGDFDAAMTAT